MDALIFQVKSDAGIIPQAKANQMGFGGALKVRVDFIYGVASPNTYDAIPAEKMR